MVVYKMHDSSLNYLKNIRREKLITENEFIEIQKFIKMNIKSNFLIIITDLFRLLICLIFFLQFLFLQINILNYSNIVLKKTLGTLKD